MEQVSRYAKLIAHEGMGDELADLLVLAGEGLREDPACLLYLVNRQTGAPDVMWVTELWRSQDDLDAAVERIRGSELLLATLLLVAGTEMIELELVGGKGPRSA